ncbi:plexin-A4-like [Diadema setosum]|uniref:plexin-A4-like n=1 Tax=Diadema setosum TaxID=31175 RepID=UPI003B3BD74F
MARNFFERNNSIVHYCVSGDRFHLFTKSIFLSLSIYLSLVILTLMLQLVSSAPLSSYLVSSFTSPNPSLRFRLMAVDNTTGDVYIGAEEEIYHLGADFILRETVEVGLCNISGSSYFGEQDKNRLLVIAPAPTERLITCGTCEGYCEIRKLSNITDAETVYGTPADRRLVVGRNDVPMVGIVAGNQNSQYLFTGISVVQMPTGNPVSKFNISSFKTDQIIAVTKLLENLHYTQVSWKSPYIYYTIQLKVENLNPAVAVIGRLCTDTTDPSLESYTQIQLECTDQAGLNYNVIQAAHIGPAGSQLADSLSINSTDDVMYAVFTKESSSPVQSALCLYKMSDIQQRFTQAVDDCFACSDGNCDGKSISFLRDSSCGLYRTSPKPESIECQATEGGNAYYAYANGVNPVNASQVLTFSDVEPTSIVTTRERDSTVAFIGSSGGDLLKVHILNESSAYQYENVPLGEGSVLQGVFLDEDKEQIILATGSDEGSQVLKLTLANCSNYQTCDECIGGNGGDDGDPYCGWCTLEASCTGYLGCDLSNESTRWLSYNAVQCVSISNIQPPSIKHDLSEQPLAITVEQLPALTNSFEYRCVFDSYEVSAVTSGNTIDCTTPPSRFVPSIPEGDDNVVVPLSIKSTESGVNFVERDFFFFDCTRISSCSSCVTSRWPCDWCVYENRCTDDSSSCVDDTIVTGINMPGQTGRRGQVYCPQLLGVPEETLIPVNIAAGYSIMASNLPTDPDKIKVTLYECVILVEGSEQAVAVTDFNETFVNCPARQYMYNREVLQTNVSVSVRWNSQNVIDDWTGSEVTLYKCSVNNGSCSRCLSPVLTPEKLECRWCGDDCNVQESDVCQRNTPLNQSQYLQCNPPEITRFYPVIGPVAGGTRVEVNGTDLGVNFEDISSITVAGTECDVNGMEEFYDPGQSVSCLTGRAGPILEGLIDLTISLDSEEREASSEEEFLYRNPTISGFTPAEGPAAGGTRVTIFGDFLTSGRNVIARFGDAECIDIVRSPNETSCTTTESPVGRQVLTMTFDGTQLTTTDVFEFMPNPVITDVDRTESIMSGGLDIIVTGERFDLIQMPLIKAVSQTSGAETSEICNRNGSATILTCPSPPYPEDTASRRRRQSEEGLKASLQFDFDGFVIDWNEIITYFPDPVYYNFDGPDSIFYLPDNNFLELKGSNLDLASNEDDVQVFVGGDGKCVVQILESEKVICKMPEKAPTTGFRNGSLGEGPTRNLPAVHVSQGNLGFSVGYVQYPTGLPLGAIIGGACGGAVLIIIVMVLVGFGLYRRSYENLDRQAQELELVEKKIQQKVEAAFHDLQADMSEVEEQVKGLGIPFVNTQDYTRNMLFSGLDVLPATSDPEYLDADLERAMIMFSRQLGNKDFLTNFIHELEDKRRSHRRDRVNIASLITVILVSEGKFEYFTKILLTLLEEKIADSADTGNMRSLFRRTETILEKLLSNWLSLCMFGFLKKHVAQSLYLLYQSIKIQCEKGPVDIVTGQSYFSLNFDCLLEEDVEFQEVNLSVVGSSGKHEYYVKVLDVDSITQAKQKILDAAYRRRHVVNQKRAHEMDLMWYHPGGEQRLLRDQDDFNTPADSSKPVQVNTIETMGVTDNNRVALIEKVASIENRSGNYQPVSVDTLMFHIYDGQGQNDARIRDYTKIQTREGGYRLWHLVPEEQMNTDAPQSRTKLDKEFSAPHLLVTKKTIEPFLNSFLSTILNKPEETPVTIKYLFDFFDDMAAQYCGGNEKVGECAEAWKSNSLPLHYWVTTLTHPSYVFDMRQSRCADQSVSVLANMLDNAFKKVIPEKKEDSSLNRVLFVKDLPGYIRTISEYYRNIASRFSPTDRDMHVEYDRIGQEFAGLFSRVGTLKQLYEFTCNDTAELLDSITELMP